MFNIGSGELVLIAVVALLVLGPKRLPELARGLGKFLREFRRQTDEVRNVVEREFYKMDQDLDALPVVPPAAPAPVAPQLTAAPDAVPTQDPAHAAPIDPNAPLSIEDPSHPDHRNDPALVPPDPEPVPAPVVNHHLDPTPSPAAVPAPPPAEPKKAS